MASNITADELAKRYQLAVQDKLGLLASVDDSDDVVFKHPDLGTFYFSLDAKDDPEYLMLVFPNFMNASATGGSREKLLNAVNKVNGRAKGVKLSIRDDEKTGESNVMATLESFVAAPNEAPSQEFLNATIKRAMSAIRAGIAALVKEVENSAGENEPSDGAGKQATTSI